MNQSISDRNNGNQSRKKTGGTLSFILFFIVFVLGFGTIGISMIRSAYKKEKSYIAATEGRIIDYKDSSYNNKHKFSPVIEYHAGSQVLTGETNVTYNYHPLKTGTYVSVYYDPENPGKFFVKEYDLKATYQIGMIFLLISIGILGITVLFTVLNKSKMNREKKAHIEGKIFLCVIFLFIFTIFSFVAGLGRTLCIFAAMGLFALYGMYQNKRKK